MEQSEEARVDAPAGFMARRPRLSALLFLFVTLVAVGLNASLLRSGGVYFPSGFVFGGGAIGFFLWVIVTGRTAAAGAPKAPRWWRVGAIACGIVGLGLGAYVVAVLRK
jgi:multisubunit Na+/H+ antiporter MnhB subunit